MADTIEKIPKNHGEFYFNPLFPQWKEDALRNRERVVKEIVWGQSAPKVRAALKLPGNQPLILSGHQPVFFHPGIWAKCLAASLLAEAVQGTACHKVTDTGLGPEFLHRMPEVEENGKSRCKPIEFFHSKDLKDQEKTVPYAFLPAPDFAGFKKIFSDVQVYGPASVKKNAALFEEKFIKGLKENPTWDAFHLFTLKMLDEFSGTSRLYLTASKLWASEPFLEFVTYWLTHLSELSETYNASLDEFRKKYQIKHDLTPLPNLKFEDWWFEIPFWGVTKYHQRHSLWAKKDGKHFLLRTKGSESTFTISLDDFQRDLSGLPISLWPKAMPQTLFCRFYLCDYFIHGVGGSVYEEVNDIFFEKLFKLKALSFGTVTATYFVEPEEEKAVENILSYEAKVQWWERALSQNPEYLFTKKESWEKELPHFMLAAFKECFNKPALQKLAAEKDKLLTEMKTAANKPEIAKKIKETNFTLYEGYTEVIRVLEQGLLDMDKVKTTKDVLSYRQYPFFCYPPKVFEEMKEKMRVAAHLE